MCWVTWQRGVQKGRGAHGQHLQQGVGGGGDEGALQAETHADTESPGQGAGLCLGAGPHMVLAVHTGQVHLGQAAIVWQDL